MCGICGILKYRSGNVDKAAVIKSSNSMTHRGPDASGFYLGDSIGFGHRRLSIIDLDKGNQPMSNKEGSIWITFNGEIYNFLEIKRKLSSFGYRFFTKSDTEAIICAYEQYGESFVHHLRGMFSFALWDDKLQKLILARDRLGIKPLYYAYDNEQFVFASELKGVLKLFPKQLEIDIISLADYLTYGYIPAPKTIFRGIFKLEPGHLLVINHDAVMEGPRRYWKLIGQPDENMREDDALEELDTIVRESVREHLISDVPVGVFLSGGIDSGGVAAYASELSDTSIDTYSIGFREGSHNEIPFARLVARHIGTRNHEKIVKSSSFSLLDDLVCQYDEPFADSSAIPTYYICQEASRSIKVCLSGDGGDEVFGGYDRYLWTINSDKIEIIPKALRKFALSVLKIFPVTDQKRINGVRYLGESFDRYSSRMMYFHPWMLSSIFSNKAKHELKDYNSLEFLLEYYNNSLESHIAKMQYAELHTYLPEDILTKVDRASMRHSLEVRLPLLDHRVVEFAMKLPSHLRLGKLGLKHLWRKLLLRRIPIEVINRPKSGFAVPLADWIRTNWYEDFRRRILNNEGLNQFFEQKFIERLLVEHKQGAVNHASRLWALIVLAAWFDNYQ